MLKGTQEREDIVHLAVAVGITMTTLSNLPPLLVLFCVYLIHLLSFHVNTFSQKEGISMSLRGRGGGGWKVVNIVLQ